MTSHDQGLYPGRQGRKMRENLGTRLRSTQNATRDVIFCLPWIKQASIAANCISVKKEINAGKGKRTHTAETHGLFLLRPPQFRSTLTKQGSIPIWSEVKFIDCDPHWYRGRVKGVTI